MDKLSGADIVMEPATSNRGANTSTGINKSRLKPLSAKQEQRLADYLEEEMIRISGDYKKRSLPTSSLRTLPDYLAAVHHLLSLIMLIPPLTHSARVLRVGMMLRLTGEILDSVVGYSPETPKEPELSDMENPHTEVIPSGPSNLRRLVSFLDDLDKAWFAILRNQIWDAEISNGRDLDDFTTASSSMSMDVDTASLHSLRAAITTPPRDSLSQTDRTRLRSLLIAGTEKLEEWLPTTGGLGLDALMIDTPDDNADSDIDLEEVNVTMGGTQQSMDDGEPNAPTQPGTSEPLRKAAMNGMNIEETLEVLSEREMFNDIFWRTLTEMGELSQR